MANREPFQTPLGADDSDNKLVEQVSSRNKPENTAVCMSADQPALLVSHSKLVFANTAPSRSVFLILTLSQQHVSTPVMLTTDAPDYFQFASDSRPAFGPTLTLTPLPTATYVHVRYAADRAGLHQGNLFIQSPYESRSIALSGRSRGLLPALRSARLSAGRVKLAYVRRLQLGSWRVGLLALFVVSGLAWGGYKYWCQLLPSLCADGADSRTFTKDNQPLPNALRADKAFDITGPTTTLPKKKKTLVTPLGRSLTNMKRSIESPAPDQSNSQRPVTPSPGSARNAVAKQADQKQADSRLRRPSVADPIAGESDLERELNANF